MRPDQNAPPPSGDFNGNTGINMLPGYSGSDAGLTPDDYQPLTGAPEFVPPPQSFVPTANAAPIPRATPVGGTDTWRLNAASYRTNYPAPGTPLNYPAPGTPSSTAPLDAPQGFLSRLLETLSGGVSDVGSIFSRFGEHPRPAPAPQPVGRSPFGMTGFQSNFPGSAIGPLSGIVNPYNPGSPLARPGPHSTAPTGYAAAFSNVVKSRNIA